MTDEKRLKVMVAMPAFHGDMKAVAMECVWGQTAWSQGVRMALASNPFAPLHAAREDLLGRALSDPEVTHCWFVDTDTMPLPNCLEELLKTNKDVVTGLYRMRSRLPGPDGARLNLLPIGPLSDEINAGSGANKDMKTRRVQMTVTVPNEGIERTGWAAGGCLLISRAAIEKLGKKAFRPVESDGEDIQFSINCEKAGIEMFVNYAARSNHMHEVQIVHDALSIPNLTWDVGVYQAHGITEVWFEPGGMPDDARLIMIRKEKDGGIKPDKLARLWKSYQNELARLAKQQGVKG